MAIEVGGDSSSISMLATISATFREILMLRGCSSLVQSWEKNHPDTSLSESSIMKGVIYHRVAR